MEPVSRGALKFNLVGLFAVIGVAALVRLVGVTLPIAASVAWAILGTATAALLVFAALGGSDAPRGLALILAVAFLAAAAALAGWWSP